MRDKTTIENKIPTRSKDTKRKILLEVNQVKRKVKKQGITTPIRDTN